MYTLLMIVIKPVTRISAMVSSNDGHIWTWKQFAAYGSVDGQIGCCQKPQWHMSALVTNETNTILPGRCTFLPVDNSSVWFSSPKTWNFSSRVQRLTNQTTWTARSEMTLCSTHVRYVRHTHIDTHTRSWSTFLDGDRIKTHNTWHCNGYYYYFLLVVLDSNCGDLTHSGGRTVTRK